MAASPMRPSRRQAAFYLFPAVGGSTDYRQTLSGYTFAIVSHVFPLDFR